MKIGVVGCGIVGSACKFGFEKIGHEVIVHDISLQTSLQDVAPCSIVYISVPTPSNEDGSCDTSIVESVVKDLNSLKYDGIVAVKSTVTPGTTRKFSELYTGFKDLCFVPEFLRERCAITDFTENHKVLVVGSTDDETYDIVEKCHGSYPQNIIQLTPTQAELLKYLHNTFNALRVVFSNEFYEICRAMDADYNGVKNGLLKTSDIPDIYLDVNDNVRGYSSICWNKDIPALIQLAKSLELSTPLINMIPEANNNFKKTPFKGTRERY